MKIVKNKLVEKYIRLLKKNVMTKTEINSMRKALGHCSSLNAAEKQEILDCFYDQVAAKGGIRITKEHTEQGLSYLKSLAWTPLGKPRQTKNNPFGYREKSILLEFQEFRLVDLIPDSNYGGVIWTYSQLWQVRGKTHFFEYRQAPGQWGGIEVTS